MRNRHAILMALLLDSEPWRGSVWSPLLLNMRSSTAWDGLNMPCSQKFVPRRCQPIPWDDISRRRTGFSASSPTALGLWKRPETELRHRHAYCSGTLVL